MKLQPLSILAGAILCLLVSCKKEEVKYGYPAPVPPAGSGLVNSVPLNGGNAVGRWTLYYVRELLYQNDTLTNTDTATFPPGDIMVELFANGDYKIWESAQADSGQYVINGNQIILDGSDAFTFGISGNRMRWRLVDTWTSGSYFMRDEVDYIFDRN